MLRKQLLVRIMRQSSFPKGRPVSRPVIDAQDVNCFAGNPVHNDVWKARDDQLACTRHSSHSTSTREDAKVIGCIEKGFRNSDRSAGPVVADEFGNLLKVVSGKFGPSYLHWVRHLWAS